MNFGGVADLDVVLNGEAADTAAMPRDSVLELLDSKLSLQTMIITQVQ